MMQKSDETDVKLAKLDMLTSFVDGAEIGLYISDYYTCEVLFANGKLAYYSGETSGRNLEGRRCWTLIDPTSESRCHFCPYEKLLDEDGNYLGPYTWEHYIEPLKMWIRIINQLITWPNGRLAHMVTFYDITETKKLQEQLTALAFKDKLLGLKNETCFDIDIMEAAAKPSLIIFDFLLLRKVNEAYGWEIGDCLLFAVRDWLLELDIPESDFYRIGGDEFALTIKNNDLDELVKYADALNARFSEPWVINRNKETLHIFCSASIAVIPGRYIKAGESVLNLIARTIDMAKERKKVIVYDNEMANEYEKRFRLELSLKKCVHKNMEGFDVHYQPLVSPESGKWHGLEALCRWNSPELGYIEPLIFIPEAERLALINAIGLWVLDTAIGECKSWRLDEQDDFVLDVNISAIQCLDPLLTNNVISILSKHEYPGKNLCIEITESTKLTFCEQSLKTIEALRGNNVLVALDDFGTGYSNFNNLKNLPVDILKIEREFITDIEKNDFQKYLLGMMTDLAHTAGMKLVAEGVEYESQRDILTEHGADSLQGYLFSKPLPSEAVNRNLHNFQNQSKR